MGNPRYRLAVTLALLLVAGLVLADQGSPVYQANGTKPVQGGTCNSERVQVEYDTGKMWCCGAGGAGLWGICGSVSTAASATALAADPAACSANQYATDINASGTLTCAQPAYANLSGLPTLAPLGASYVVGAADPTLTAERVATDTASIDVDIGTAGQMKWSVITPVATATSLASDPVACGANLFATDISALGVLTCTQPAFTNFSGSLLGSQMINDAVADRVFVSGGGGAPHYVTGLTVSASEVLASVPLELAPLGAATSGTTTFDSQPIRLSGSYWNGSVATEYQAEIALDVLNTNPQGRIVFNLGGVTKMYVNDVGLVSATSFAGSGLALDSVVNDNVPSATLGTCDGSNDGRLQIKRAASTPDQVFMCLRNQDATWDWSMIGLAKK